MPGSGAFLVSQGIYNALRHGNVDNKRGILRRLPGTTTGGTTTGTTNPPLEKFEFFYHGDHLGSSSFITDDAGAVYQHLEYFPYGETWVEDGGSGQMPMYRFTGKELDPETGLYYYGARYYDPVLSRWISADPILGKYLPTGNKKKDRDLPGIGGVFNPPNLAVHAYSHQNPVKYSDPDGKAVFIGGHNAADPVGRITDPDSYHLTIILAPDRPSDFTNTTGWTVLPSGRQFATLGGQPSGIAGPLGNLQSAPNYPGDNPLKATFWQRVEAPEGMTDTQFINGLINASSSYKNDLSYDLFPEYSDGYNSNSYIAGIIKAAGAELPVLNTGGQFNAPGYSKPIPLPSGGVMNEGPGGTISSIRSAPTGGSNLLPVPSGQQKSPWALY